MTSSVFTKREVHNLQKSIDYSAGAIVSKIVTRNQAGTITLFAFDKGQNLSEHTAPFDALVHLLDGKALIRIDKEQFVLSAGDLLIMPAHIPHAVDAVEPFKMLLTMLKSEVE